MAIDWTGFAYPKARAKVLERIDVKAQRAKQEWVFRNLVWLRDQGHCRGCNRRVFRANVDMLKRGEVHHRHGRNVKPEHRFSVDHALLLCKKCHADPATIARFRT